MGNDNIFRDRFSLSGLKLAGSLKMTLNFLFSCFQPSSAGTPKIIILFFFFKCGCVSLCVCMCCMCVFPGHMQVVWRVMGICEPPSLGAGN